MTFIKYSLEIYKPGEIHTPWFRLESPSPLPPINLGQLINPASWGEGPTNRSDGLRVVSVEHFFFPMEADKKLDEIENWHHRRSIFTELVGRIEAIQTN